MNFKIEVDVGGLFSVADFGGETLIATYKNLYGY